jgi:hypothetical protein
MGCQQSFVYLPGDPNQPILDGLLLWLDASRGVQKRGQYVTQWNSCIVDRQLVSSEGYPIFKDSDTSFPAHVEFDHNRSMKIVPPLLDIETIISVHCWKAPTSPERIPFYIICGTDQGPFQGNSDKHGICSETQQGEPYYQSSIRLNGVSHRSNEVKVWRDQMKIASIVFDSRVPVNRNHLGVNQIGRAQIDPQTSHEFAGYLTELLVFHRRLSENEIVVIENYLRVKYVMYFNEASSYQTSQQPLVGQPVPQSHQQSQPFYHGPGYQPHQYPQQQSPFPPQQNPHYQYPPQQQTHYPIQQGYQQGYPHQQPQQYQPQAKQAALPLHYPPQSHYHHPPSATPPQLVQGYQPQPQYHQPYPQAYPPPPQTPYQQPYPPQHQPQYAQAQYHHQQQYPPGPMAPPHPGVSSGYPAPSEKPIPAAFPLPPTISYEL